VTAAYLGTGAIRPSCPHDTWSVSARRLSG
jgi:hypothetical protein